MSSSAPASAGSVRNVCLTELKRASRKQAVPLDDEAFPDAVPESLRTDPAEAGAELDIEAILTQLPEKYQRVLRLFYLEGKSYEETAALLGQPIGTVKTNLFRARQELARLAAGEMAPTNRL